MDKLCSFIVRLETIEYEAGLKHQNEMKRLEAELRGKYVYTVRPFLVEQCCNNTVIMAEQCCSLLFQQCRSLLFQQCCSLLFQQCCSALMKQQRLFTVVGTGENDIDRTSLFVIVIIVAQPC